PTWDRPRSGAGWMCASRSATTTAERSAIASTTSQPLHPGPSPCRPRSGAEPDPTASAANPRLSVFATSPLLGPTKPAPPAAWDLVLLLSVARGRLRDRLRCRFDVRSGRKDRHAGA